MGTTTTAGTIGFRSFPHRDCRAVGRRVRADNRSAGPGESAGARPGRSPRPAEPDGDPGEPVLADRRAAGVEGLGYGPHQLLQPLDLSRLDQDLTLPPRSALEVAHHHRPAAN